MKIIAHRGASGHAPENTIAAIRLAIEMRCDAIEIDVFNVDGHLVVIHDRWSSRTTNGRLRLDQISFDDLRKLDAGDNQQVPTLWEVLVEINGKCDVNVEIKGKNTLAPTLTMIERACSELQFSIGQFLLSSFNHNWLKHAHQTMPLLKLGALTGGSPNDYGAFAERINAYSVNVDINFICPEFVEDIHRRNMKAYVYTVNEPCDIKDMIEMGVDGIFTNYPQLAAKIYKEHNASLRSVK